MPGMERARARTRWPAGVLRQIDRQHRAGACGGGTYSFLPSRVAARNARAVAGASVSRQADGHAWVIITLSTATRELREAAAARHQQRSIRHPCTVAQLDLKAAPHQTTPPHQGGMFSVMTRERRFPRLGRPAPPARTRPVLVLPSSVGVLARACKQEWKRRRGGGRPCFGPWIARPRQSWIRFRRLHARSITARSRSQSPWGIFVASRACIASCLADCLNRTNPRASTRLQQSTLNMAKQLVQQLTRPGKTWTGMQTHLELDAAERSLLRRRTRISIGNGRRRDFWPACFRLAWRENQTVAQGMTSRKLCAWPASGC
jgi:hypothetical protein